MLNPVGRVEHRLLKVTQGNAVSAVRFNNVEVLTSRLRGRCCGRMTRE
uniref:Uncharacterized protein n=1 Tax=Anguilla anguilla TaxID=7936 RepID=A0A0E9S1C3_ANGAN